MNGRWKLLIGRGQIIGYETDSGNRMISNPSMDMHTVPVVPVDDAAVERAAAAYEIGGQCSPAHKCGGDCPTAHIHRMRLAFRAAGEVSP